MISRSPAERILLGNEICHDAVANLAADDSTTLFRRLMLRRIPGHRPAETHRPRTNQIHGAGAQENTLGENDITLPLAKQTATEEQQRQHTRFSKHSDSTHGLR